MSATRPTGAERRRNHSLRRQAQAWFDALRAEIATMEGAEAVTAAITNWRKPEDVMRDCPALVPLFLDMAWRARRSAAFADLVRTESGEVAETTLDILAMSQKSFEDVLIAHLMGTVRLACERRQNTWLTAERERRRSRWARIPVIGAVLRGLGLVRPVKTDVLLADYPQRGLYEALRPFLRARDQFTLVETLATVPTRTISALGPAFGALRTQNVLAAIASLDRGAVKVALDLAERHVDAVQGDAVSESGTETATETATPAHDRAQAVGEALAAMLSANSSLIAVAVDHRELAKDAIGRLAPVMGEESWSVFGNVRSLRCIAECPPAIIVCLKSLAALIDERVSIVLSEIAEARVATFALEHLRSRVEPDAFLSWLSDETYISVWKQMVQALNREATAPPGTERLGPTHRTTIKTICERYAAAFSDVAAPMAAAA